MKITAEKARKLAGPALEERLDEVYAPIRAAAERGKQRIIIRTTW